SPGPCEAYAGSPKRLRRDCCSPQTAAEGQYQRTLDHSGASELEMREDTNEGPPISPDVSTDSDARWLLVLRSSTLLSITLAGTVLGLGLTGKDLATRAYLWQNFTPEGSKSREYLLLAVLVAIGVGAALLPLLQLIRLRDTDFARRSAWWVRKFLPLGPLAL